MQLQRQKERRQLRLLIELQKIGCLHLEGAGDLLNLLPEGGYGDHEPSNGSGVRVRCGQDLLKLLLGLGRFFHHRL